MAVMNDRVHLFLSPEHVCGYLPDRMARNAYLDPALVMSGTRYGWLLENGFRRSGSHVYRPHCASCQRCIPARILVAHFEPTRSQRRCRQRNRDLRVRVSNQLNDSHFALYRRYLSARHRDGGMEPDNREAFQQFLSCAWGEVQIWEYWRDQHLLAFAIVDRLPSALSAVYTCFDPDFPERSLGTFAVLEQIAYAQQADLPHVYLGYWVPGSPKMEYKRHFQPLEVLSGGQWRRFPAG